MSRALSPANGHLEEACSKRTVRRILSPVWVMQRAEGTIQYLKHTPERDWLSHGYLFLAATTLPRFPSSSQEFIFGIPTVWGK